jgi:hypothetical protein
VNLITRREGGGSSSNQTSEEWNCDYCKKKFTVQAHQATNWPYKSRDPENDYNWHHFCSQQCYNYGKGNYSGGTVGSSKKCALGSCGKDIPQRGDKKMKTINGRKFYFCCEEHEQEFMTSYQEYENKRPDCHQCHKKIYGQPVMFKGKEEKFCSEECARSWERNQYSGGGKDYYSETKTCSKCGNSITGEYYSWKGRSFCASCVTVNCEHCKKQGIPVEGSGWILIDLGFFCSEECISEFTQKFNQFEGKEEAEEEQENQNNYYCEQCKENFSHHPYGKLKTGEIFCSSSCWVKFETNDLGENPKVGAINETVLLDQSEDKNKTKTTSLEKNQGLIQAEKDKIDSAPPFLPVKKIGRFFFLVLGYL